MATATKIMFRGAVSTDTSAVLYTVPALTSAVLTNIAVTNTSNTDATFTISLDDIEIQSETSVPANITAYIDLKQVLESGDTIKGGASASGVNFHISGVEIS